MAPSQDTVGVLTVDDSAQFRGAARALIAATDGFEVLGEAGSGEDGLVAAARLQPDLVLLDVRMPGIDGIETARRLARGDQRPVVMLVSSEDPADLPSTAYTCGAAALVRKQDLAPGRLRALWAAHGRFSHG